MCFLKIPNLKYCRKNAIAVKLFHVSHFCTPEIAFVLLFDRLIRLSLSALFLGLSCSLFLNVDLTFHLCEMLFA